MSERYQKIHIIDSHTGGEPTRMVYAGFPDLGKGSMAERLDVLKNQYDHYRRGVILEPRGNDVLVGALLCEPVNPQAAGGVIFFNNTGYLNMCGHGTIGLIASMAYQGKIKAGVHTIETPVGDVVCTLHDDGSVSIDNVPAYRYREKVAVDVEGLGTVVGDIAWGGNWFFLVSQHFTDIKAGNVEALTEITWRIRQALIAQNITGENGGDIDHIELFQDCDFADSQSFVLCPGKQYDRSPCGTGTSAKIACLAADGKLKEGDTWQQASVIGSQFTASYKRIDANTVRPTIRGNAYISAETTVVLDNQDPFQWGISA